MTKFVVLCFIRTGTHMMCSALGSHPDIYCAWEVFNPIQQHRRPPEEILGGVWGNNKVNGFPLHFENDARCKEWLPVYEMLKEQNVKFIYLHRQNTLRQYLSHKKADLTKTWNIQRERSDLNLKLKVRISTMMAYLASMDEWQVKAKEYLDGSDYFEVYYEEMPGMLPEIQKFLGARVLGLKPKTLRIEERPVMEIVKNYGQVKRALRGTQWEWMLDA